MKDYNEADNLSKLRTEKAYKAAPKSNAKAPSAKELGASKHDYQSTYSKAFENSSIRVVDNVNRNTKELMLSAVDNEGQSLKQTIKTTQRNIQTSKDAMRVIFDTPNQIARSYEVAKIGGSKLNNVKRYAKGESTKKYQSEKVFTYKKNKTYLNKEYGKMISIKNSKVNLKLRELKNKQKTGIITDKEKHELFKLKKMKSDKALSGRFERKSKAYKGIGNRASSGVRKNIENNESSGSEQLFVTYDFAKNKHVQRLVKESTKMGYQASKYVTVQSAKGSMKLAKHYGVDVDAAKIGINNGISKIAHSAPVSSIKTAGYQVKNFANGGAYKKVDGFLTEKAPKIKTGLTKAGKAINKSKFKLKKAKTKVSNSRFGKASSGLGKIGKLIGSKIDAFLLAKETLKALIKKYLLIGIASVVGIGIVLNLVSSSASLIISRFATSDENVQKYVSYIEERITEYELELDKAIEEAIRNNDSLNDARINYTHQPYIDNMKAVLSLAAVYNDQEWPEWYEISETGKMKTYIDQLFDDSHNYEISLSPTYHCEGCKERERENCEIVVDELGVESTVCETETVDYCDGHRDVIATVTSYDIDDIFAVDTTGSAINKEENWTGWDEGNIEWAKILYDQDWYEEYGVIVSTGGQYITLTPEEIEYYYNLIPEDLDENRKRVLNNSIDAIGKIPYYWNWREITSLKPNINANGFGQTVRPDRFGVTNLGLDCSGFVMWAFYSSGYHPKDDAMWGGLNWGNTTSIYYSPKTSVTTRSQLKPGDLGMIQIAGGKSNHVGIYLGNDENGNALWIHDSKGHEGVVVTTFPRFKILLKVHLFD